MNLLDDPLLTMAPQGRVTLPGLLAAMARGEVRGFPALRPHQRAAWHAFLVFLAAYALFRADRRDLPQTEGEWRALLVALTDGHDDPWRLVAPEDEAAFLQPPAPAGLGWKPVETPDALDLLITSRNHDLKTRVAAEAAPEMWVYALVSLQTSEGFGGAGNYGAARMNGGSSSRAMLAFVPDPEGRGTIDPARWWRRDVETLLCRRAQGLEQAPGQPGGAALLWCLPWPEGVQLDLTRLDPWFIEVCRRVRLEGADGAITARRSTSKAARIAAKAFAGVTGDPWAPVSATDPAKSLTIGEGDFTYRRMKALLFSGEWRRPPLAEPGPGEGAGVLLAEALGRGNSRTDGLKSRLIAVPAEVAGALWSPTMAELAEAQIAEIRLFDEALKFGLATAAADGAREVPKGAYAASNPARAAFDARADVLFFPALFARAMAAADSPQAEEVERRRFLGALKAAAEAEFDAALPALPVSAYFRHRAEIRGRRAFHGTLRRSDLAALIPWPEQRDDDAA